MKILLLSDLHTEHGPVSLRVPRGVDVIVLAGDIGVGTRGLRWARWMFPDHSIVYVAGNHEFYGGDIDAVLDGLRAESVRWGIDFLEQSAVVIDGVRFLGTTLWSDFAGWHPAAVRAALSDLSDYDCIDARRWWSSPGRARRAEREMTELLGPKAGDGCWTAACRQTGRLHPVIVRAMHRRSVRWLERQLDSPFAGPTVAVTHHAPSYRSLTEGGLSASSLDPSRWRSRFVDMACIAAYASDLDGRLLGKRRPDLWLHGHWHHAVDYRLQGVRIVSNPRGYPMPGALLTGDGVGFSWKKTVTVRQPSATASTPGTPRRWPSRWLRSLGEAVADQ